MKYKLSVVSYLNTIPFIYGLKQYGLDKKLDISLDIPSACSEKLLSKKVDIGLVPIVVLKQLEDAQIISDYCIGANGAVDTVCLFSDVSFDAVEGILLDYQSRTSVELLKILLKEHWRISPKLIEANENYETQISGKTAGLIIGDRAFHFHDKFKYAYDLSDIWKQMTGLSFVFACWIANKELDAGFKKEFNNALKFGVENIEGAIKSAADIYNHCKNPQDYLNNKISYLLDEEKRKGMELFLEKI